MKRVLTLMIIAGIGFTSCNQPKQKEESANSKPNILIILADDMGYSDIGPFGAIFKRR